MKVSYTIDEKEKTISLKSDKEGYNVVWNNDTEIQPLFNYVMIEKDEEKSVSNGGILLPDNVKEKPSTGVVIAVGEGSYNEETGKLKPMSVKIGDRVLFGKLSGQKFNINGIERTLLNIVD